ncbi:23S rRNA (uracil(1939)-C(5))-methyltransferase RlmD [Bacillus sp. BGMRC 2118]|nr:23S rRNA (uracil(1939)-C(5))-methyltransferase RlmD [Bacillus sp. BGMRC 2118]
MKNKQQAGAVLEKGQAFPLTIKRLGINGEGVGYFKRKVVFVPGALPGEEIVAEATNVQNSFIEGKVKKIRKSSPDRVAPPCPVFETCGGCQLQHLKYETQLKEKRDIIIQALEKYTKLDTSKLDIRSTIGMENPWNYRNKSQLQVGIQKQKVIAGLYGMNSHELIDITECKVQHEGTNKVSQVVKQILQELQIPIYNERSRKGLIRTIVTRVGIETGELQVVLITTKQDIPKREILIKKIKQRLPEVKSIMQNINGEKTSLIFGDRTLHLAGKETIQEVLGDLSFELSARAFFQLNPTQTVKLYDEVKEAAALTGREKVVDAYCGVGTIGLWLAKEAAEIRGMDVIPDSVEDARKNAASHGFSSARYEVGKAEVILPKWLKDGWKPDVIVVDPPRVGLDTGLLETIKKVKPKKVVYVSCNPSTLAKDIASFETLYKVEYLQPLDMFPHTSHIECVAQLIKK